MEVGAMACSQTRLAGDVHRPCEILDENMRYDLSGDVRDALHQEVGDPRPYRRPMAPAPFPLGIPPCCGQAAPFGLLVRVIYVTGTANQAR